MYIPQFDITIDQVSQKELDKGLLSYDSFMKLFEIGEPLTSTQEERVEAVGNYLYIGDYDTDAKFFAYFEVPQKHVRKILEAGEVVVEMSPLAYYWAKPFANVHPTDIFTEIKITQEKGA